METTGHSGETGINMLFIYLCFFVHCLIFHESGMQITCGTLGLSTATVKLADADGKEHCACSMGTGPVDSAYKAVDLIVKVLSIHSHIQITSPVDTQIFKTLLPLCRNRRLCLSTQ